MDNDFTPEEVLCRPLMAHLASGSPEGPRDSPLWFLWEDEAIWLIATSRDRFPKRLNARVDAFRPLFDRLLLLPDQVKTFLMDAINRSEKGFSTRVTPTSDAR